MSNRIILEGVGIVSVIGSLIFVGLEISQNTAAVRGATQQDISYQISEMYKIGAENDKIASIMSRSYQGITKEELADTDYLQFWLFSMMGYRRVENIYLQYKNGFLSEDAFDRIGMSFYRTPLQRQIWEERKYDFDPEFAFFLKPFETALNEKNNFNHDTILACSARTTYQSASQLDHLQL